MSGFKNKLLSLTIIYLFQSSMGLNVHKAKHNPNFTFNTFFSSDFGRARCLETFGSNSGTSW